MNINLKITTKNLDHAVTITKWLCDKDYPFSYIKDSTMQHVITIYDTPVNTVLDIVNTLAHKSNFEVETC